MRRERAASVMAREVADLARRVDHVIVSLHWQPNWAPAVAPRFRSLARTLVEAGGRVIWGHSPHHFQGVEWRGGNVVLYSTGDLVDDYAVHPDYRNDRQLLFELELEPGAVARVRAHPLELLFARTEPASGEVRRWLVARFGEMCREFGSKVVAPPDAGPIEILAGS